MMTARPDTLHYRIKINPQLRGLLHFHLEASDGLAYLETAGDDPAYGMLEVPPELEPEALAWLAAWQDELGLSWQTP